MAIKSFITKFGKGAATKQIYLYETWLRWIVRGIQFILAVIVCGLYGHRVDKDHKEGNSQSVAWVYALIVGGLSCITCVLYAIPNPFSRLQSHRLFAWDSILFVMWIAVFGTFAVIFLKRDEDEYEGTSVTLMKCAVWVDLVNAIFWAGTAAYGCFRTFIARKVNDKIDEYSNKVEDKITAKVGETINTKIGDKIGAKVGDKINARVGQYAGSAANNFSMKLNPLHKETV